MKRREFIKLLGAATTAWPLAAHAQQTERMPRIGVLMNVDNSDNRATHAAFLQALQQLGWIGGQNVRIDTRWAGAAASDIRGGLKGSTQHLILERQDGVCDVSEAYTRFHCGREDCALGSLAAGRVAEGDWASVW